jgi:5-methylcytosine-specific restriction protein A
MVIKNIKDTIQGKASLGQKRSSHWPTVRKHHLKENPTCAVCGDTSKLEVHHIKPFHTHPELELEPTNLITMCESKSYGIICHLYYGHLGNYKNINPNVVRDAAAAAKILKEANKDYGKKNKC